MYIIWCTSHGVVMICVSHFLVSRLFGACLVGPFLASYIFFSIVHIVFVCCTPSDDILTVMACSKSAVIQMCITFLQNTPTGSSTIAHFVKLMHGCENICRWRCIDYYSMPSLSELTQCIPHPKCSANKVKWHMIGLIPVLRIQ